MKLAFILSVTLLSLSSFAKENDLTFDKKFLTKIDNKTIHQILCMDPTAYQSKQACKELSQNNEDLNWKALKVQNVSAKSFTMSHAGTTVEISRTSNPNVFLVNRKNIDMSKHLGFGSLREAILNVWPKTAHYSIWINFAHAQNLAVREQIGTTVAAILVSTSDQDVCEGVKKIASVCDKHLDDSPAGKSLMALLSDLGKRALANQNAGLIAKNSGMTRAERQMFDTSLAILNAELSLIGSVVAKLKDKKAAIMSCPSVTGKPDVTGWEDIQSCRAGIMESIGRLGHMPQLLPALRGTDKDLERLTQYEEAVTTETKKLHPTPASKSKSRP